MSAVVIRCPNCGTTQSSLGECEACHHAAVRYYCTNHTPGRWLDGASCPDCGARFGAAALPPAPKGRSPRASPAPTTRPSVEWKPPASEPADTLPPWLARRPRRSIEPPDSDDFGGEVPHAERPSEPASGPITGPAWTTVTPDRAARMLARGAVSCVGRLFMLLVAFIVLAMLLVGGFMGGVFGATESRLPDRLAHAALRASEPALTG